MEINISNKELYESAFITGGEYAASIKNPTWKPSINEREIEDHTSSINEDGEETWIPATPLGYRNYTESREEGLKLLFNTEIAVSLPYDDIHSIKINEEPFKQYDHIKIDDYDYIITGNDESHIYIVDKDDTAFCIEYNKK